MTLQVIGFTLFAAAFLLFARGIVSRSNGRSFKPLPVFGLFVAGFAVAFFSPAESLFYRIAHLLLEAGAGVMAGAAYLALRREKALLFAAPGILALILGGTIYFLGFLIHFFDKPWQQDSSAISQALVELGPDDKPAEIQVILDKYHARLEKAFPGVSMAESEDLAQYYIVYVDSAIRDALMLDLKHDVENVDHVESNDPIRVEDPAPEPSASSGNAFLANDPYLQNQWYADKLDYNGVYAFLKEHKPVRKAKVAIVDTGVDSGHEDLSGVYERTGGDGDQDRHSHGTHCAGLATAATNNGKGIGSLNWDGEYLSLSGYPALDASGRGTDVTVSRAILAAADGGADVISLSLGGPSLFGPPKAQSDAIQYARKKGAIVVVAAGNSNDDARRYSPANIKGVITVSAVNEQLEKAPFSNTNSGLKMPIASPGVNIFSSIPGGQYQSFNGTSMATPIVSGLIGVMRSLNPSLTGEQAYEIIKATGKQLNDSDKVGLLIQPKAALEAAAKGM